MKSPRLAHNWERHPDDYYIEPEWTSRRLFEEHVFHGTIYDPACGSGRIVKAAREQGRVAFASDIRARTIEFPVPMLDFLDPKFVGPEADNIVSNPPYKFCDSESDFAFVRLALERAKRQVALLLPASFQYGDKRRKFLHTTPLEFVYSITPRPSMPPGPVIEAGDKPGQGTKDFAWFVWRKPFIGEPTLRWLSKDRFK